MLNLLLGAKNHAICLDCVVLYLLYLRKENIANMIKDKLVESTSKCKIIIFFCRTRILVFENLVFVLAFCLFSSVSLQFFCL